MSITFSLPGIPSLIRMGPHSLFECMEWEQKNGENCDLCTYADGPGVNLSNANAWRILGALGIEQDYCGGIAVSDLRGRILLAQGVGPRSTLDVADPASRSLMAALSGSEPGKGATVMDCSAPLDELLARRLPELLALCDVADSLGLAEVEWA